MTTEPLPPGVVLHAPTAEALSRARSNARNLRAAAPSLTIEIVVNADGVRAALDAPDPVLDPLLVLCERTLARIERSAPEGTRTTPVAALRLIERQHAGWAYLRA